MTTPPGGNASCHTVDRLGRIAHFFFFFKVDGATLAKAAFLPYKTKNAPAMNMFPP